MAAPTPTPAQTTTNDLGVIVRANIKREEDADQALAELSSKAKIHEVDDLSTLTQIDLDEALKLIHPTFAGKLREPLKKYIKPAPPPGNHGGTGELANEGLYSGDTSIVTERKETVELIQIMLQKHRYVHIRAPPFSGKTALAQLLEKAVAGKRRVIRLTYGRIYDKKGFTHHFNEHTNQEWGTFLESAEEALVIVDEAQGSYDKKNEGDSRLWQAIKSILGNEHKAKQIITLAAYGENEEVGFLTTPVKIPPDLVIELAPRSAIQVAGGTIPGLLGAKSEYDEMIASFKYFELDPASKEYIALLTGKHIGLVKAILQHLSVNIANTQKDPAQLPSNIWKELNSVRLYDYLTGYARGLPRTVLVSKMELEVADLLLHSSRPRNMSSFTDNQKIGIERLVKRGWVFIANGKVLTFTSPIHERTYFVTRHSMPRALKANDKLDFEDFIMECVRRMSPEQLRNSKSIGAQDNSNPPSTRLLERQWQMEFYRTATSILPGDHFISPDFPATSLTGENSGGALNFFINDKLNWGVELLREGQDMKAHEDRFKKGGAYYDIAQGMNNWAIVDFRSSEHKVVKRHNRFYHVIYAQDFSEATIYNVKEKSSKRIKLIGNMEFTCKALVQAEDDKMSDD